MTVTDMEFERGLPASLDAERTILGAILLENQAYNDAAEKISADDFAHGAHQRIFARMAELIDNGRQVDLVTLSEELARRKEIESIGGVAYLSSLTEGLPRNLAIDEYVAIVRNKALLRQIILIGSDAITRAADQADDALEVLNATEGALLQVADRSISQGFSSIPDIVSGSFGTIDKLFAEGSREITGLATHFDEFDKMTSGLQASELIIIAARPSMGKTALAINVAQNAAVRGGKVVAVFSLEMSKESLLRRMLASESLVDSQKIQKGFFTRDDQQKLTMALERLVESRMYVDDTPGISLAEMRAKARRLMKQQGGLDLIVIDYLQLMTGTPAGGNKRFENRTQEVSAISRGLKALAKELKIPVIALSQLSRASEQRGGDKKPMLSDLCWFYAILPAILELSCQRFSGYASTRSTVMLPGTTGATHGMEARCHPRRRRAILNLHLPCRWRRYISAYGQIFIIAMIVSSSGTPGKIRSLVACPVICTSEIVSVAQE